MKSKNELKGIGIKNRVCCYFDDMINGTKMNFSNISLNQKLYENISVYSISYKISTGPKPLHVRIDKTDRFIISLDGKIKYVVLFDYGLLDKICGKIKYLISKKSGITNSTYYNFGKIEIDSYYSLPIKKILTFFNVIILISLFFSEKGSYKDKSNKRYF